MFGRTGLLGGSVAPGLQHVSLPVKLQPASTIRAVHTLTDHVACRHAAPNELDGSPCMYVLSPSPPMTADRG